MNKFKVYYEDKNKQKQVQKVRSILDLKGMNDALNYANLCEFLKAKYIIKIEEV